MLCQQCQQNEATIHLTQVVEGSVKKLHLCEACAAKSGIDVSGPVSITDILLGMGGTSAAAESDSPALTCPFCNLRRTDFKKTGRLGCPHCYDVFSDELGALIKAMHRSELHLGKAPRQEDTRLRIVSEVATLEKALHEAVAEENFEAAAQYRDQIRTARKKLASPSAGSDGHEH